MGGAERERDEASSIFPKGMKTKKRERVFHLVQESSGELIKMCLPGQTRESPSHLLLTQHS